MNRLDTLKVRFDAGAIDHINKDYLDYAQGGNNPENIRYNLWHLKKGITTPCGFNSFSVDFENNVAKLELSAKRLEKGYGELIHRNNIEYLVSQINNTGIVSIDKNEFVDTAKVLRFDVSANLHGFPNHQQYINAVNVISASNSKYRSFPYDRQGIAFKHKAKRNKTEFRLYPKYPEFMQKRNEDIRLFCDAENFRDVLRPEMQLVKFDEMRKMIGITDTRPVTLGDVLNSDKNLLYNGFQRVIRYDFNKYEIEDAKAMKFIADTLTNDDLKFSAKERAIGEYMICRFFGGDIHKISAFLSNEIKGNFSAYRRRYAKAVDKMPTEENIKQVDEFMNALRNAA